MGSNLTIHGCDYCHNLVILDALFVTIQSETTDLILKVAPLTMLTSQMLRLVSNTDVLLPAW